MKALPNSAGRQSGVTPEMVVRVRAPELHAFTSTRQFDRVAAEHGFTDTASFERYLTALLVEAGIDYEGLRQTEAARRNAHQRLVAMAARGPRLTLWSAATMTTFTVCRADGQVIWHDLFPRDTALHNGAAAAEASARQAIWLAGQARTQWGAEAATLHLILARSRRVNFEDLHRAAASADLVLDVATDPVHNPAAEQCTRRDAVDCHSSDLGGLQHTRGVGMTRTTLLTVVITLVALSAGCAGNTATSSNELDCRALRFAPPFGEVEPCSADAVLTAAVSTVFSYRPSEHLDQRAALRAARPVMDPGFADRAESAALVWAPVSATQWQQWRTDATTIAVSARVTSDDHPADTVTTARRVLAVELEPRNQLPIRWVVYAHATRTSAGSAWLLSGLEVQPE